MGISDETLAAARKYTQDSLAGVGALAGKPCQIQSIASITGGNRVTFLWVDDNGDSHTSTMDVLNGVQGDPGDPGAPGDPGQDGVGIKSLAINSSNHLIVTLTDDTTVDAGEIPAVQSDWDQSDSDAADYIKNKPTLGTAAAKNSTNAVTEESTDLIESGAVFTGLAAKADKTDVATDIQKVYNVMGQNGAKNLFDINSSQIATSGTLTATVGENGSITIDGTGTSAFALPNLASGNFNGMVYDLKPSTKYVISYGIAQTNALKLQAFSKDTAAGSWTKFAESTGANSLEFTTPASFYDLWVRVLLDAGTAVSSLTFYPMIRLADDTDGTYQPYAMNNQLLTGSAQNSHENGVVNLCPSITGTYSTNGITMVCNTDGTVTISGTATANATLTLAKMTIKEPLKLCGCPSGSEGSKYCMQAVDLDHVSDYNYKDFGNGVIIPQYANQVDIRVVVFSGTAISGSITFKPMLTLDNYPFSDYAHYVPYAMTNRELMTPDNIITYHKVGGGATTMRIYRYGGIKLIAFQGDSTSETFTNGLIYTLTSELPIVSASFPCYYLDRSGTSTDKIGFITILTNGKIELRDDRYQAVTGAVAYIRAQGWYF